MHSGANEITASCCDISRKVLWKEKANIGNRKTFVQEFTEVLFFFFHFTDLEQPNDFLLKYAASMKLRKGSFLLFTEKTELH